MVDKTVIHIECARLPDDTVNAQVRRTGNDPLIILFGIERALDEIADSANCNFCYILDLLNDIHKLQHNVSVDIRFERGD